MIENNNTVNLSEQLKEALEWCGESEDSSRKEIMVDKCVYKNTERVSKMLNTDVEGVFTLAAYQILKKERSALALHQLIITNRLREGMRSRCVRDASAWLP